MFVTTDDDIREWWSRWRVDRYSVAFGVAFGAALLALQRIDHVPGTALAPFLALVSLAAYTTFTILCFSISECEEIHSYVVFIPVNLHLFYCFMEEEFYTRFQSLIKRNRKTVCIFFFHFGALRSEKTNFSSFMFW